MYPDVHITAEMSCFGKISRYYLTITFNFKNEPVTVPTSEEFDEIEKSSDTCAFASPAQKSRTFVLLFLFSVLVACTLSSPAPHSLIIMSG